MQGKERMIEDIVASAKKTAAAMIAEAEQEAAARLAAVRSELERAAADEDAVISDASERAYMGRVKLGELDAGKFLLAAKQTCIAETYARVRDMILALPDAKYLKLMQTLISENAEDGDKVVVSKRDAKRITADWLKKVSAACKKKLTLAAKASDEFDGGVILISAEYERDLSVDAIVDDLRERTLSETAAALGL